MTDIPVETLDLPPGRQQRLWSPISATLIYGERDAVLVDAFITVEQAHALVEWVEARGKNLTTIYVTHARGGEIHAAAGLASVYRELLERAVSGPDPGPARDRR